MISHRFFQLFGRIVFYGAIAHAAVRITGDPYNGLLFLVVAALYYGISASLTTSVILESMLEIAGEEAEYLEPLL